VAVNVRGPLFDGRAAKAVEAFSRDAEREVAREGAGLVRARLRGVLRHPTGYYESRVTSTDNRVHDSRVVYGPWLEGVGERNKTTRFKGYATFRRTTSELRAKAPAIARAILPKYLGRMQ
jgi:hypothetical protein